MQFGFDPKTAQRADDLIGAIDRLAAALNANTAAIVEANRQRDDLMNGPRG
ncbi:hypothetical protein SEA_JOLENE_41 [Mycobacterium phage Jolene]|uniref:Uncharacterized protein n=1 Tax=Mycobacterium phage Liefie TaxID=2922994 RepID=G1JY15_9CAUD|nr:hypothetical protein M695_gp40 [Mycobacterium phage Leo]YP_009013770.1 hypothetical protein CL64_gp41 [Mycobacterium phage Liefie]AGK85886.1 hypothetical protein Chy2_0040 [Mycobacterium phage Chy2]AGK85945.1 hypothetical protein Chy3_0041 [Mycobacterium phage Chy3]AGK86142.1 hypothetical protein Bo4_0019 [Mycobacterium phage Bo4]AGK86221.1 hypothetical protein DNAIII_0040 [Mycobacterium phage DNAIII]AGK86259.1 hypothetical protein Legendre_0018 [Mycobacterium phage Legendre]AGK86399.1 hy